MSEKTASKIVAGLEDAAEYGRVRQAVFDWIKEDVPLSVKMTLGPEHWTKLIDRICGSTTRHVTGK